MKNQKKIIVYVVGGSGLIGKAIVKSFQNKKNYIINLDIKKSGKNFVFFDCTKLENIQMRLREIFKKFGVPDVLINCSYPVVGDWTKNNFNNLNIDSSKNNIEAHLLSYTFIANEIAKKMVSKRKIGKIILFSSIYGFLAQNLNNYKKTDMRENVTYSMIKAGIINLVKQMSSYYGSKGLEINSVSPGAVKGHVKGSSKKQKINFVKEYSRNTALKRLANPIEIANLVKYLSSKECSYITGQNIVIDGGYSIT